ncbi:MAG: hypothetical protein VW450_06560, partial [Chloroflexota bacterium]
ALGTDTNGRALIVTAGHCVFDEGGTGFVTNWVYIPDYDNGGSCSKGTGPYGMWAASALLTTTAWTGRDFDHDYAFAVVTENQGVRKTRLQQGPGSQPGPRLVWGDAGL